MRRSASTLQYNIVQGIMEDQNALDLGWVPPLPRRPFDFRKLKYDGGHEYIFLRCHAYMPRFSSRANDLLKRDRLWAVYTYRDVRDVVASLIRFEPSLQEGGLEFTGDLRAILNEFKEWHQVPRSRLYVSRYESVVGDIEQEAINIAHFLGIDLSQDKAIAIAEKYSLESQVKFIDEQLNGEPPGKKLLGGNRILWSNHIGNHDAPFGIGQYQQALTDEQQEAIAIMAGDWLRRRGYT